MDPKQTLLTSAIGVILGGASLGAQAGLTTGAVLAFDPGEYWCVGIFAPTPGNTCYYGITVKSGSYFGVDINQDGAIDWFEKTALTMRNGIQMGINQAASGSHIGNAFGSSNGYTGSHFVAVGVDPGTSGSPSDDKPLYLLQGFDPSDPNFDPNVGATTDTTDPNIVIVTTTESPGIDEPWIMTGIDLLFTPDAAKIVYGGTGMHYTTSPITVVNNDVNGDGGFTKTLDFSGWGMAWNGIENISLGAGPDNGLATITCSTASCSASSTFTLDYSATLPENNYATWLPAGNNLYQLHLEGTISAVPLPAAVWLFGSGLLGLIGMARRKRIY